jgi:hypothetical protein
MDASVLAAIAKWPDVPDVYGWLRLTARGEWRLRGEPIGNAAIREFIGRNYAHDERGCWYFQNGPQRVFVELELTPWIYRLDANSRLLAHTCAAPRRLLGAALLDDGHLVVQSEIGAGAIDDRDMPIVLSALTGDGGAPLTFEALERWLGGAVGTTLDMDAAAFGLAGDRVPVQRLSVAQLGTRFGFERVPVP